MQAAHQAAGRGALHNGLADEAIQRHTAHVNARRHELYELDIFLAVIYEGGRTRAATSTRLREALREPREAFRRWLSTKTTVRLLAEDLDRAVARLQERAAAFEIQLADSLRPVVLDKRDAF